MTNEVASTTISERARLQFSLNALLGMVAGCALLFAAIRWLDVLVLYLAFGVLGVALPLLVWRTQGTGLRWVVVGATCAGLFAIPLTLEAAMRGDVSMMHVVLLATLGGSISGGAGAIKNKRLWLGLAVLTPSLLLTFAFRPEFIRAAQAIVHWLDVLPLLVRGGLFLIARESCARTMRLVVPGMTRF